MGDLFNKKNKLSIQEIRNAFEKADKKNAARKQSYKQDQQHESSTVRKNLIKRFFSTWKGGRVYKNREPRTEKSFPWLLLTFFLLSIYIFWILPQQIQHLPVEVIFTEGKKI